MECNTIHFCTLTFKWLLQNNCVHLWKDNGRSRPFIPKGRVPTLRIRPHWVHNLARHYRDMEVATEDAHDAKRKRRRIRRRNPLRYKELH